MTPKTSKLDVRLSEDERANLEGLARRHGRTCGAEMRAALDAWREMHRPAKWLDADSGL